MTIRVVQRALKVLECFEEGRPTLSLHVISQSIDLPKSTTFRIVSTLLEEGYLIQLKNQEYGLSYKLLRLAGAAQQRLGVYDIVHPALEQIAAETGETVEVSRLDGDARICIDVVESSSSLKSIVNIGARLPLFWGATGKMFLAGMPAEDVAALLAAANLPAAERAQLTAQLGRIGAEGVCVTRDERVRGATAIAVPLGRALDDTPLCLTITGPSGRFAGREKVLRTLMLTAGRDLSARLGGPRHES